MKDIYEVSLPDSAKADFLVFGEKLREEREKAASTQEALRQQINTIANYECKGALEAGEILE